MELVRYDAAKRAVAEYKTVDEVKDFRDKALAIEAYAKQANDYELEKDAAIARVRAERRCGQLLAETEKARGGEQYHRSSGATSATANKTLAEMGVTKDQSSQWQKLAQVPDDEFEQAVSTSLTGGTKPTAKNIVRMTSEPEPEPEPQRMDKQALWLWGRLRDMRESGLFNQPPDYYVGEWTDAMREDAGPIIQQLKRWITQ